jgi:hypothetical protein
MDPNATLDHINELRDHVSTEFFVGFDASRFPHSTLPVLALVARLAQRFSGDLHHNSSRTPFVFRLPASPMRALLTSFHCLSRDTAWMN